MSLKKILINAVEKRFEAQSIIYQIEKKIEAMAEQSVIKKYKEETFFKNNLEFELHGVKARLISPGPHSIEEAKIDLNLVFFCKSKLPKTKRELIEKRKKEYENDPTWFYHWSCLKIPLWYNITFTISIDNILSNNFRLDFKNINID